MSDIALDEKLLPCPHCGEKEHEIGVGDAGHSVTCHSFSCRASTGLWHTRDQAIAAWNRRTSPSQVAPQPQAGEAVKVYEPYPGAFDSILGPASLQPANPAQVTDAMVKAFISASSIASGDTEECVRAALTAAIGAGGQAVADSLWVPAKPEHKKIGWTYDFDQTERLSRAAEKATGYEGTMEVIEFVMAEADRRHKSALSHPHPADERVVEAASAVLKWLDGGCSSWGVPEQQIRILALSATEGR